MGQMSRAFQHHIPRPRNAPGHPLAPGGRRQLIQAPRHHQRRHRDPIQRLALIEPRHRQHHVAIRTLRHRPERRLGGRHASRIRALPDGSADRLARDRLHAVPRIERPELGRDELLRPGRVPPAERRTRLRQHHGAPDMRRGRQQPLHDHPAQAMPDQDRPIQLQRLDEPGQRRRQRLHRHQRQRRRIGISRHVPSDRPILLAEMRQLRREHRRTAADPMQEQDRHPLPLLEIDDVGRLAHLAHIHLTDLVRRLDDPGFVFDCTHGSRW